MSPQPWALRRCILPLSSTAGHPVTAGGQPLSYVWDLLTNTLYATPDGDPAHAAFKISVDPSTGAYSFSLLGQIDHPGHDADGLNNGPDTAYEDNININLSLTVTDRDGDAATGASRSRSTTTCRCWTFGATTA